MVELPAIDPEETAKADMDMLLYGSGYVLVNPDGTTKHIPLKDILKDPPTTADSAEGSE